MVKTIRDARVSIRGIKLNQIELNFKDGPTVYPLSPSFQYPQNLSYDNYIVGFIHNPTGLGVYPNGGVNIIMSNGDRSNLPFNRK